MIIYLKSTYSGLAKDLFTTTLFLMGLSYQLSLLLQVKTSHLPFR
ncbi:hypothetical protein Pint_35347 [Pistacia integerrima]|uniref:Uncharacterized protein n=1 Tax=Pistacia integerrima TaxID=434235 RepID=A0ACC0Y185_9ROSI|nr:hypothetical protein Pint_35347 [Pistacia integerrima]